ncbi:phage-like protein, partial [Pseudomonas syringae pv. actinidiae ICMP 18807]
MSIGSFYKQSAKDGMITLQPAAADLDALTKFAAVVPKAAAAAQRRAINKTLRWLRTHIAREVGRQE